MSMNLKHAALASFALAAVAAAPAFAQTSVQSSTGLTVSSGTGVPVTPAAAGASTSVTVMPSTAVAVESTHLLPGGAMVPANSTAVLGGPAGNVSGSQTVTTSYWVNVPPDAARRGDFQRWQALK
jgi:hypothetical protein